MAKYTELEMENNKSTKLSDGSIADTNNQIAKNKLISLIMEKVDNGSNIDYIVKLSEIYRNIK